MQDPVVVQELQAREDHDHVSFDVRGREDDRLTVPYDLLQVDVHEVVDQADIRRLAEHVDQLHKQIGFERRPLPSPAHPPHTNQP
jgi:hypothetical protein